MNGAALHRHCAAHGKTTDEMLKFLSAPDGRSYLRPSIVRERLESEFAYVATSEQAGREFFRSVFGGKSDAPAPLRRSVDDLNFLPVEEPGAGALYVQCGDDLSSETTLLGMFVIPGEPIIFDYTSPENERSTLPLVERCAAVLGYRISAAD